MLYISTQDLRGADVTIEIPRAASLFAPAGFPMNFRLERFETRMIEFPVGNNELDIRVATESDQGIHIFSTNGAKLDIVGVNGDTSKYDAFLALPCKLMENENQGSFHTPVYKYFIFSAFEAGSFSSRFMIIPCTAGGSNGNSGIQYTLPTGERIELTALVQYETHLVQRSFDLTGTVITSPFPLAVFASHECGRMPMGVKGCDHLLDQIPPDITYGTRFFVLPITVRESGDIIRVGSTVDNNEVTITCTRRQADGSVEVNTVNQTINEGRFFSHRTFKRISELGLTSEDYRRDYCAIETSKPAIVMQYSLGYSEDNVH